MMTSLLAQLEKRNLNNVFGTVYQKIKELPKQAAHTIQQNCGTRFRTAIIFF
jgi:hypothetical protein